MNRVEEAYLKEYARLYTAFTPRRTEILPKWIEFALRFKKRRGLLVDVGCGPAEFYTLARKFGYSYLGIDANSYMVERAKKEMPKAKVQQGWASELPVNDSGAQVVLMNMLINSIGSLWELSEVFEEADRVLNPRGLLIVTTLDEEKTVKLLPKKRKLGHNPIPINFEAVFPRGRLLMKAFHWPKQSISGLLELVGFQVLPIHLISTGLLPNDNTYNMFWAVKGD